MQQTVVKVKITGILGYLCAIASSSSSLRHQLALSGSFPVRNCAGASMANVIIPGIDQFRWASVLVEGRDVEQ